MEIKVLKGLLWGEYSGRRKNLGSRLLEFSLLNTVVIGRLKVERLSLSLEAVVLYPEIQY